MSFNDDIENDVLASLDDFGVSALYKGQTETKTIIVIFDQPNPVVNPETMRLENTRPEALVRTSDILGVRNEDTLNIEVRGCDTEFKVMEIFREDGGTTRLMLKDISGA